jgi:hypothetical protein
VKTKFVLIAAMFAALVSSAQTNIEYKTVVVTNWYRAPANFSRFGNEVIDTSKPNKLIVYVSGNVNSVQDGIVTLDIYKSIYHSGAATGNAGIGAFSVGGGSGGWSEKTFDRTVVITNLPDIANVTENKPVSTKAIRKGTVTIEGHTLEFYDCGTPWIYRTIATNQVPIKLKQ